MLKPPGMKGEELFLHMIEFRELHHKKEKDDPSCACCGGHPFYNGSRGLDVEIRPDNREILDTTARFVLGKGFVGKRAVAQDAFGVGRGLRLAKRTLTAHAMVKSHCGIMNSDKALNNMESNMQLLQSISQINELEQKENEAQKAKSIDDMKEMAPTALKKMIAKQGDLNSALKKQEIASVLYVHYNITADFQKTKKATLVDRLRNNINSNFKALGFGHNVVNLSKLNK